MTEKLNKDQQELLEWYENEMPQDAFTNPQGETNFGFPVGQAISTAQDNETPKPAMEIEIKPKGEENFKEDDIKNIENWAEIHKAIAFVKAILTKLDYLSGEKPEQKDEESKKKCKNEVKALITKVTEIIDKI